MAEGSEESCLKFKVTGLKFKVKGLKLKVYDGMLTFKVTTYNLQL